MPAFRCFVYRIQKTYKLISPREWKLSMKVSTTGNNTNCKKLIRIFPPSFSSKCSFILSRNSIKVTFYVFIYFSCISYIFNFWFSSLFVDGNVSVENRGKPIKGWHRLVWCFLIPFITSLEDIFITRPYIKTYHDAKSKQKVEKISNFPDHKLRLLSH